MALAIEPGPLGLWHDDDRIDPGTLARTTTPQPGPVGQWIIPPFPMQVKATAQAAGVRVHAQSQIDASGWVKKIKDSGEVPDYFKTQIVSAGDVIQVMNPKKFKYPKDVIPKIWLSDWLSAFIANDWELTTGCLDIVVTKSGKPAITVVHNPDLGSGESINGFTKHTMTATGDSPSAISIEKGNTLPTGVKLTSGRKLIAVANRISLNLGGKVEMLTFEDFELLEVWFHELAAHAGRFSTNLSNAHGDITVDSHARDIKDMFPKATTVQKLFEKIDTFLQAKSKPPAKGK